MLSINKAISLIGIEGRIINVQVDISPGIPKWEMVGMLDTSIKEAKERIKIAIKNSGIQLVGKQVSVNLSPAEIRKGGSNFDLTITVGILENLGIIPANKDKENSLYFGEIAYDGTILPVDGILPLCIEAQKRGFNKIFVPEKNAREALMVKNIEIIKVESIKDLIEKIKKNIKGKINQEDEMVIKEKYDCDFSEVHGQSNIKRVAEIATSGGHNMVMIGEPGVGKTMIAKRIRTILPKLKYEEGIEISKIRSIKGEFDYNKIERPFIEINSKITLAAFMGGGINPKPGAISRANKGILFADELLEFDSEKINILRGILDNKYVQIDRTKLSVKYPADFMFIATMNPCPCGFWGSKTKKCICSTEKIRKYFSKISGPIWDRIDLQVNVPKVNIEEAFCKEEEQSSKIKMRVENTRKIQEERFKKEEIKLNAEMKSEDVQKYCDLDENAKKFILKVLKKYNLSFRSYNNILKVSRTIADMEAKDRIDVNCIAEALQYRAGDKLMQMV